MIKEYAVEPAALNCMEHMRFLRDKFGFANRRVIAQYPQNRQKKVLDSCTTLKPVEKKKYREYLIRLKKAMVETDRPYVQSKTWIHNVNKAHPLDPFHGIVVIKRKEYNLPFIERDEFDQEHILVKLNKTPCIARIASKMAEFVSPLFKFSRRIVFVDPYFERLQERHLNVLKHFLKELKKWNNRYLFDNIQYVTGNSISSNYLRNELKRLIKPELPSNLSIYFYQYNSTNLHNRFVLSEKGGVMFGIGLDEDDDGSKKHDTLSILDENRHKELWNYYYNTQNEPIIKL